MPLEQMTTVEVLSGVGFILIGALVEKHYVSWPTVVSNIWTMILSVISFPNIRLEVKLAMGLYWLLGILVVLIKLKYSPHGLLLRLLNYLSWLFSSKFIGGVLIVLSMIDAGLPILWPVNKDLGFLVLDTSNVQPILYSLFAYGTISLVLGSVLGMFMPELKKGK